MTTVKVIGRSFLGLFSLAALATAIYLIRFGFYAAAHGIQQPDLRGYNFLVIPGVYLAGGGLIGIKIALTGYLFRFDDVLKPKASRWSELTREQVAEKIHWPKIIWAAGIVNVGAMLPQLWQIIATRQTQGLNLGMFWIYFLVQVALSLQGFFRRDKMLMWCLGLSALVSMAIIVLTVYYRQI